MGWKRGTGRRGHGATGLRARGGRRAASHFQVTVSPSLGELSDAPAVPYAKLPLEKGTRQTQAGSVLQLVLITPSKALPGPSLPTIWEQS